MPTVDLLLRGYNVATDQGSLGASTVTLVRGQKNILVDVGPYGRRALLEAALRQRGLTPDDIDVVVITHAHWDHAQNVDLCKRARLLISRAEVEYTRSPRPGDFATPSYFAATLQGLDVEYAREGMQPEPGVTIIETPGHTAGHLSVVVETDQGAVVLAADALSDADSLDRGHPFIIFWDVEQAVASMKKILARGSVIYPGHDRPFRVVDGRPEYLVPPQGITITGFLEYRGSVASSSWGLGERRVPVIHPEARQAAARE